MKILRPLLIVLSALLPCALAAQNEVVQMGAVDGEILVLCTDSAKNVLYAYGDYEEADGEKVKGKVIRWDGSKWEAVGEAFDQGVLVLYMHKGKLYAGGSFTKVGGAAANHIAVWNGKSWSPVGRGFDNAVLTLSEYKGKLYAGGLFAKSGSENMPGLAIISGDTIAADAQLKPRSGTQAYVSDLQKWQDKLVMLGIGYTIGKFTGPVYVFDGKSWSTSGLTSIGINYMRVYKDRVYMGGEFIGDGSIKNILSWDGKTIDNMQGGTANRVMGMQVAGGKLICFGDFNKAGDVRTWYLAAWNGSTWEAIPVFRGATNPVRAIAWYDDKLIIGGKFKGLNKGTVKYVCGYDLKQQK